MWGGQFELIVDNELIISGLAAMHRLARELRDEEEGSRHRVCWAIGRPIGSYFPEIQARPRRIRQMRSAILLRTL